MKKQSRISKSAARVRRFFTGAQNEISASNLTQLRLCCLFGALLTPIFIIIGSVVGDVAFSAWFIAPLAVFAAFLTLSLLPLGRKMSAGAVQWACGAFCALTLAALSACSLADESGGAAALAPLFIVAAPSLFTVDPLALGVILTAGAAANITLNLKLASPETASFSVNFTLAALAFALPLLYMTTKRRARDYFSRMKFRRMSMIDRMTGVLNKAAFEQSAREYLAERAEGELCALFIFDLDRFKDVNDTLGHAAGDALIEGVGERLSACFRSYDIVGRVGGDEFAALMKQVGNISSVSRKAAELQKALPSESFERIGRSVSASIGVAYTSLRIDYDELYKSADVNLYRAKNAGRNRAVVKAVATRTPSHEKENDNA